MHGLAAALGRAQLPVLIHPEFWTRRRVAIPGREPIELPTTSRGALEGAGFEIVEQRQPSFLLDGSLLVTGEVDRTTGFERGFPAHQADRHGRVAAGPADPRRPGARRHVRGRGLVVLTGCGHSGIVNILRYVAELTGEDHLHAVIGGFHLSGRAVRADHRADLRRARRARARLPRAVPLHRLARDPHARRAVAGRVHPEQRRQPLHLRRGLGGRPGVGRGDEPDGRAADHRAVGSLPGGVAVGERLGDLGRRRSPCSPLRRISSAPGPIASMASSASSMSLPMK